MSRGGGSPALTGFQPEQWEVITGWMLQTRPKSSNLTKRCEAFLSYSISPVRKLRCRKPGELQSHNLAIPGRARMQTQVRGLQIPVLSLVAFSTSQPKCDVLAFMFSSLSPIFLSESRSCGLAMVGLEPTLPVSVFLVLEFGGHTTMPSLVLLPEDVSLMVFIC